MKDLPECLLRKTNAADAALCYETAMNQERVARMLQTYWTNAVDATGGLEGTKNRSEQDSLQNA